MGTVLTVFRIDSLLTKFIRLKWSKARLIYFDFLNTGLKAGAISKKLAAAI
jgi:hypothetical protein